jgi:hypothetical protein
MAIRSVRRGNALKGSKFRKAIVGCRQKEYYFRWPMFFASYYLWVAPHLLLAVFLIFLIRRGLQGRLPVFLAYVIFELVQFLTLFAIFRHDPFPVAIYQWVLVFGRGINSILGLGVIYELANELLLSRSSLASILRPILRGSLAALVLVAAVVSGSLSDLSLQRVVNIFEMLDFSWSLIFVGMLLALFVFARALRISLRSWVAGVALGFGISASIDLASAAFRAGLGKSAFIAVDITQMAAFHVCVIIWLISLFLSGRTPSFADAKMKAADLELWDEEMQRMVQR